MTPEMIDLARRNAGKRQAAGAPSNVEFHLAMIDALPLADSSVDCVISNCVINLAPDKRAVFREIARVLKPGGGSPSATSHSSSRCLPNWATTSWLTWVASLVRLRLKIIGKDW